MPDDFLQLVALAANETHLPISDARHMIHLISRLFRQTMLDAGHDGRQITRITTKFRDSGRRSPPWRPASSRVPGRPQDGADGNRINRWLLEKGHKFYADEITATLVEVKYYLQAFSMTGAPSIPSEVGVAFSWLIEHPVEPGMYVDPIQVIPINLHEVVTDARLIQSGHLIPLDRGGQHEPKNAFLMLARSNQLQGNLTVDELLRLMQDILARHQQRPAPHVS
jgi:hypothetical protein